MSMRRTHQHRVRHSRQLDVGDESPLAGDEAAILLATDRLPHQAAGGFVQDNLPAPATAYLDCQRSDSCYVRAARTFSSMPARSWRAASDVLRSIFTNRVGVCGCSWPIRSMSAEITVPTMK